MAYIYGLFCPRTNELRYVGKADRLEERLRRHINQARSGRTTHHCSTWIRSLLKDGAEPMMSPLCRVGEFEWQVVERFLIASGRHFGLQLTNATEGGEGVGRVDPETLKKRGEEIRRARAKPGVIVRHSEATKRAMNDPAVRARYLEAFHAASSRPETKANHLAAVQSESFRSKQAAIRSAKWQDQGYKERTIAAMRAKIKSMWADPEKRAQMIESKKASWAKRKGL